METKFGGLFLEVGDAAGLSDRGLLEGFRFVVGHAGGDDRGEDALELVRDGGEAQGGGHASDDFGRIKGHGRINGQVRYRPSPPHSCPFVVKNPPPIPENLRL